MAAATLPYAAFISYAPLDWAKANDICALLEDYGLRCLMAPRGLRGNRGLARELRRGIEQSRAFVLVVSKATEASPPVQEEMRAASQRRMPMFAIFVEPPDPSNELDLVIPDQARIGAWSGRLADHVGKLAGYLPSGKSGAARLVKERELSGWARRATGTPGIVSALALSALLLWALHQL
ncbi:MAG: toll/interleukin-1 receptor domain-containing protein, partial [Alphaproteobacteria bacterium]